MNSLSRFTHPAFGIARMVIGLLFACHGGQKIFGFPPGGHGMPHEMLGIVAGWIELVCGFFIAFGFLTRIAAFIAAGEMAVAYFMVHAKGGFFPILNHGEAAVFYCFFFLFLLFHGPGYWSLDAILFRKGAMVSAN